MRPAASESPAVRRLLVSLAVLALALFLLLPPPNNSAAIGAKTL